MAEEMKKTTSPFGLSVQVALWLVILSFVLYVSTTLFGWPDGVYRGALTFICHLVNFYAVYSWLMPVFYENRKYGAVAVSMIFLLLLLTLARLIIEKQFDMVPGAPIASLSPAKGRIGFVLFSELSITAFASLLRLASANEATNKKMVELEKLQLETELKFLKMQTNPHFLFNTINNVYSLALIKSDKAPEALLKLSGLLRYMLYESHNKMPLEREIETLQVYKDLFQLKYEKSLRIQINNNVKRPEIVMEPLLLIPLLENALKHSGIGVKDDAFSVFTLDEINDHLLITVENSKMKASIADEPGGIGLENIRRRLQRLSSGHSLTIEENPDVFIVRLKIPVT